jgi:hypothetical protein
LSRWNCAEIEPDDVFHGVAIALDGDNKPIIAYQKVLDMEPSALMTAFPTSSLSGNCGPNSGIVKTWRCNTLDSGTSNLDEASSIAMGMSSSGYGAIAYYEEDSYYTTGRLKVAAQYHTLNTEISGKGLVFSSSAGITSCGSHCFEYAAQTTVTLSPLALPKDSFRGWSLPECPGISPCQILMDQSKSVLARFSPFQWNLFLPAINKHNTK